MDDALLARLDLSRPVLLWSLEMFSIMVGRYDHGLPRQAAEAERTRGRRFAVGLIEQWPTARVATIVRHQWRRDRVVACAYHGIGEFERAARHLRASIIEHCCDHGSCMFAPTVLVYLYLAAGLTFEAAMTTVAIPCLCVAKEVIDLVPPARVRRIVDELLAEHRGAAADARIPELVDALGSGDADAESAALAALEAHGPSASPALKAALPACGPRGRKRVQAVLALWALRRAARRFWTPATA